MSWSGMISQRVLGAIAHPNWNPGDDYQLLTGCENGVPLRRIAVGLMRDPRAVQQRWHRLRVVPGVKAALEPHKASHRPYDYGDML